MLDFAVNECFAGRCVGPEQFSCSGDEAQLHLVARQVRRWKCRDVGRRCQKLASRHDSLPLRPSTQHQGQNMPCITSKRAQRTEGLDHACHQATLFTGRTTRGGLQLKSARLCLVAHQTSAEVERTNNTLDFMAHGTTIPAERRTCILQPSNGLLYRSAEHDRRFHAGRSCSL